MQRYKQITRMEDYERFELDVGKTLMANLIGILFVVVILIYLFLTLNFIENLPDQNMQLIALIVYIFSMLKLISLIGYPTLEYKLREKGK